MQADPNMMLNMYKSHEENLEQEKRRLVKQMRSIDSELDALKTLIALTTKRLSGVEESTHAQVELDLPPLESGPFIPTSPPMGVRVKRENGEMRQQPKSFPRRGTWLEKLSFVIDEKDRFLHHSEIHEGLKEHGIEITSANLSANLSRLRGSLRRVNYNRAMRMTFYGTDRMVEEVDGDYEIADEKYEPIGGEMEFADKETAVVD